MPHVAAVLKCIYIVQVLPQSSSLSTSHCFLLKTTSNVYAWSGQYSSSTERRAALLIAKVVRNRLVECGVVLLVY